MADAFTQNKNCRLAELKMTNVTHFTRAVLASCQQLGPVITGAMLASALPPAVLPPLARLALQNKKTKTKR